MTSYYGLWLGPLIKINHAFHWRELLFNSQMRAGKARMKDDSSNHPEKRIWIKKNLVQTGHRWKDWFQLLSLEYVSSRLNIYFLIGEILWHFKQYSSYCLLHKLENILSGRKIFRIFDQRGKSVDFETLTHYT